VPIRADQFRHSAGLLLNPVSQRLQAAEAARRRYQIIPWRASRPA
jgi:hypothetical protein